MSKIITFSTAFPSYHPRKGKRTFFPEQILSQLGIDYTTIEYMDMLDELNPNKIPLCREFWENLKVEFTEDKKGHTIRAGHRWKVGDKFSPAIWQLPGGRYTKGNKQIIIAPDITVVKTWDVAISNAGVGFLSKQNESDELLVSFIDIVQLEMIAKNDGLELLDLINWFNKPMVGQIICWAENINY